MARLQLADASEYYKEYKNTTKQQSTKQIISQVLTMTKPLTHFDEQGAAHMVDVSEKSPTKRIARATAQVQMLRDTWAAIAAQRVKKGDVLEVARLAGIMAAKQTATLIPLCHPLAIEKAAIDFELPKPEISAGEFVCLKIRAVVQITGRTGVEMEALTAVSVAALTVYDMCKGIDRAMQVLNIQLEEKSGGQSGHFVRE